MKSMLERFWSHAAAVLLSALLAGCRTVPPNSLATHNSAKWGNAIASYQAGDLTNSPPRGCIVFVGSSSIRLWTNMAADFPGFPVVNRGFGGSQLADSVNFADRIITPCAPRQVVIYAGGNDINMVKIIDGQYCGACHNGNIAWSIENCNMCHSAKPGTPTQVHESTIQKLAAPQGGGR